MYRSSISCGERPARVIAGALLAAVLVGAAPAAAQQGPPAPGAAAPETPASAPAEPAAPARDAERVRALLAEGARAAGEAVGRVPEASPDYLDMGAGYDLLKYTLRTVALLGALCALAYLMVKVLGPRVGPLAGRSGDAIRVREMKRLDPKTTLYLVEATGRFVLLSVSDREVRALTTMELDARAIEQSLQDRLPAPSGARTFASLLARGPRLDAGAGTGTGTGAAKREG